MSHEQTIRVSNKWAGSGWTAIVTTYRGAGLPHLRSLIESNPLADVRISNNQGTGPKELEWRNCDRALRNWWRGNRDTVITDRIAVLEHDVLVTCPLPDIYPKGLSGETVKIQGSEWWWWPELDHLPDLKAFAVGIAPLAVMFFSREALDALIAPEWDAIFEADVFCELRTPTVVAACGFPVEETPLPFVSDLDVEPDRGPGIYHKIKERVSESEW